MLGLFEAPNDVPFFFASSPPFFAALEIGVSFLKTLPLGGGDMPKILEGLKRVRPYLRREMAAQLSLRYIPDLSFAADNSFDEAAHILTLLHKPEVARDLRDDDEDSADDESPIDTPPIDKPDGA